ncbi:hypothetical protein Droror1_Dr00027092, partial [Drosera rotundifolia]
MTCPWCRKPASPRTTRPRMYHLHALGTPNIAHTSTFPTNFSPLNKTLKSSPTTALVCADKPKPQPQIIKLFLKT